MTRDLQDYQHETMHECPECGKRSLARINASRFHCLSCRFDRDVDQIDTTKKPTDGGKVITGLMLLALSGFIVFSLHETECQKPGANAWSYCTSTQFKE
jgi:hypothetical protein